MRSPGRKEPEVGVVVEGVANNPRTKAGVVTLDSATLNAEEELKIQPI